MDGFVKPKTSTPGGHTGAPLERYTKLYEQKCGIFTFVRGGFVSCERQGKNLTEQSFVTYLVPTPTRTPRDAVILRCGALK